MIKIKTAKEISTLREGGRRHAHILATLADMCVPGASSFELEELARNLCRQAEVTPAFLNYQPEGASYPYPAALCFSLNEEIVHGLPNVQEKILQSGDILTLDLGIKYEGLITDAAITLIVGDGDEAAYKIVECAEGALEAGIEAAQPEAPVSEIGAAIEKYVRRHGDYAIFRELVGHGVGHHVHEEPNIPNFATGAKSPKLPIGAVIAIEPMIGEGSQRIKLLADDYTYITADNSRAVHVEHTVAITADGPLILTQP